MSDELSLDLTPRNDELDGVLLLSAVLRHGLDVEVYPRQVLVAPGEGGAELSFVHGVPGVSGLGPVTYAQDKRMRRALMERAGVPVPKGATFTVGRGIPGAKNFAEQLGFPVTVAPAIGDNSVETFRNLRSRNDISVALEYLSTPPAERANFTRAAYGLTELREPGESDGRRVVPPGYMFLLEKQLVGEYIHILLVGGQVRSVILCDGVPSDKTLTGGEEMLDKAHPELLDLARRAAKVIPGLGVVTLGIVVPDPFSSLAEQVVGIVDYSERPSLWVQASVDDRLASRLAGDILKAYAADSGRPLIEPRQELRMVLEVHAMPDVLEGAESIERAAQEIGVAVDVVSTDAVAGSVTLNSEPAPEAIARLTNSLLAGTIEGQRAMLVVLRHAHP